VVWARRQRHTATERSAETPHRPRLIAAGGGYE